MSSDLEQRDFERFLEKRWKRYRAGQECYKLKSIILIAAIRGAGNTAAFLRKMRLLKQIRRERVAVE